MKLFTGFKKFFNKTISLAPHQRNEVVSFVKLRNGMVKIGSDLQVEQGYNLVFVYYNKVCDILNSGDHKFNEEVAPKLFRYSKAVLSNKGLFTPKSLKADVYFVNLKEITHNLFKTQERIVAYKDDEKVKIKLDGNFSFKIVDVEKCMKALCNDYAIIRNKKIVKELCSTVGFEVSKALNKKDFSLDDYFFNKEKICKVIEDGVNAHTANFGVEVSKFLINHVTVPKKYETEAEFKQTTNFSESTDNNDIAKIVEDRLNDLQKDLNIVYVNENGENIINNHEVNTQQTNTNEDNIQSVSNNFQENYIPNNNANVNSNEFISNNNLTNAGNINMQDSSIESYVPSNQPEPRLFTNSKAEENLNGVVINDEFVDNLIEKISKRRKQKKNSRIVQILTDAGIAGTEVANAKISDKKCKYCSNDLTEDAKFCAKCGKSVEELLICSCCGAKNFNNAEICCVCKSKLN